MRKSFFAFCLTSLLFVSPVLAFDDDLHPYFGISLGTALTSVNRLSDSSGSLNTDFDPGYVAGASLGISFDAGTGMNIEKFRVEGEVAYRSSDLVKMRSADGQTANMSGVVSMTDFMLNGYVENSSFISAEVPLNLFLMAGVGVAMASIGDISYQGTTIISPASNTQLAYQGGFGAGYEFGRNVVIDATYRYMGTTAFRFAGVKADYGSHNILLGARYVFK